MNEMSTRADAALIAALEAADIHPLWDRYQRVTPIRPKAQDGPMHWRWTDDILPFTERAAHEVGLDDAERRALILANPAFHGATVTTGNLIGAFTVLEPGDRARPHRHTASAIRFATLAEGAATIVNGRRCDMLPGDLILTPPMCWHGHINETNHRIMWFDSANMPLVNDLKTGFFEPGVHFPEEFWKVDAAEERLFAEAGLLPADRPAALNVPKYRYPGEATRRLLAALPASADGTRTARYVNPLTGGAVMPTMDVYAQRLPAGVETRPRRQTWNVICLVVSGAGSSTIGERRFEWSTNDVFTIPHWEWVSHKAGPEGADLFLSTDRSVIEALDMAREELAQ